MNTEVARNEPCPCGSGKKFKRCHGIGAAPKLTEAKKTNPMPPGMDPAQMDQDALKKIQESIARLPKAQSKKLMELAQKAMLGKDVSKEADELQGNLPVELQNLLMQAQSSIPEGAMEQMTQAPPAEKKWTRIWNKIRGKN